MYANMRLPTSSRGQLRHHEVSPSSRPKKQSRSSFILSESRKKQTVGHQQHQLRHHEVSPSGRSISINSERRRQVNESASNQRIGINNKKRQSNGSMTQAQAQAQAQVQAQVQFSSRFSSRFSSQLIPNSHLTNIPIKVRLSSRQV